MVVYGTAADGGVMKLHAVFQGREKNIETPSMPVQIEIESEQHWQNGQ